MLYRIVIAWFENGDLKEGKRKQIFQTPQLLNIGGLYFLRPGRLYRIVEKIEIGEG